MLSSRQGFSKYLRLTEILYSCMIVASFYLLLVSRTGEAHTVWEVLNPFFIPSLLATTVTLFIVLFSSEKVTYKLLFIIVYSVLIHSFFPIIFPAGDSSGQQITLGRTRLAFDNAVVHGWAPWPLEVQGMAYEWFRGATFQAALSVIIARMLSTDLLWVHLFLVPVLWGVFVPIATFLTTKALGGKEEVAILSSQMISAFPYATYFGAISVPNSLGFIFFFFSLLMILRILDSNNKKTKVLTVAFSFFSFISHFLTGVMSISLLLLALALKSHESEKTGSSVTSKASLGMSFLLSALLLPLSFIYLRFLSPATNTAFTLDKFHELPLQEILGLSLFGELIYGYDLKTILLIVVGPTLAILYMIYLLYKFKQNSAAKYWMRITFIITAFVIILIDYRILKLFMEGLPLNEERLWVFQDFIAAPFVALAIYAAVSWLRMLLEATHPLTVSIMSLRRLSKRNILRTLSLLITLNALIPLILGGWTTLSLYAAYPRAAPLQTTSYELDAVRYIEEHTHEKYIVIGDHWTIYAGEVIVGVNNPRAYYFLEFDKTGYDLFHRMVEDPSPQVMIEAMNVTDARVAYFIVTEPRLGTQEFNRVVSQTLKNQQLGVLGVFGEGKLYVFAYEKT